ncbi:MAG: glycosyltransferase [Clostridia bacterium]|nr:glycosyltransferase [Clostridia bacterium]
MKISLCIPMYNETSIIADTARTLVEYMQNHFPDDYEIIFSDDGSTDGSADVVRALGLPGVRVVGYAKNRGKGCAVRTALLAAEGDLVMFTDADLAYGTDVIARVVETFDANPTSGMVIGSRNLSADGYEGYTPLRRLMSKVYIRVLCFVGGFRLSDSQCGCKAFRREAVQAIFPHCEVDGFAFDFEAILWAQKLGIRITEMPVKIINHRESKVRVLRDTVKMLGDLRKMRKRISAVKL